MLFSQSPSCRKEKQRLITWFKQERIQKVKNGGIIIELKNDAEFTFGEDYVATIPSKKLPNLRSYVPSKKKKISVVRFCCGN